MYRRLSTYIILSLISFCSCGPKTDQILVMPGLGLVIKKDTVKLFNTKESDIFHLFKMKDTLFDIVQGRECSYDDIGNIISMEIYTKEIIHDGIVFKFIGYVQKEPRTLEEIRISDTTHWTVKVNDSLILGKNIPDILKYFPKRNASDAYLNYSMDLWSYGISLGLKDNGSGKKLSDISVFMPHELKPIPCCE